MRGVNPAALSLLELPEARRIASTWPSVASGKTRRVDSKLIREWAAAASVTEEMIQAAHPGLFRSGVLLEDGRIDPTAAKYITAAAFAAARIQAKREKAQQQ